jgi:hypothetical protein
LTATAYNTFVEKRKKEKERTQKKVNWRKCGAATETFGSGTEKKKN